MDEDVAPHLPSGWNTGPILKDEMDIGEPTLPQLSNKNLGVKPGKSLKRQMLRKRGQNSRAQQRRISARIEKATTASDRSAEKTSKRDQRQRQKKDSKRLWLTEDT